MNDLLKRLATAARTYLDAQHAYMVALACHPRERETISKAVAGINAAEAALRALLDEVPQ